MCCVSWCKRGGAEQPDFDPQDGAICPLGQVHMLGLEQKPSPHVLRQIAAKKNVAYGQTT